MAVLSAFAKVTAISGALDLARHVTLIAMAAALLSMDSCHAHIAGAVGTLAVVVLGRGQYGVFGPWASRRGFAGSSPIRRPAVLTILTPVTRCDVSGGVA